MKESFITLPNPLLIFGGGFLNHSTLCSCMEEVFLSDAISYAFKQCHLSFHCLFIFNQIKVTNWQYAMRGITLRHVSLLLKYLCASSDIRSNLTSICRVSLVIHKSLTFWLCLQELIEITLYPVLASQAQNHMRSSCILMLSLIMSSGTLVHFFSWKRHWKTVNPPNISLTCSICTAETSRFFSGTT